MTNRTFALRNASFRSLLLTIGVLLAVEAVRAQKIPGPASSGQIADSKVAYVTALFLSDLHFDPFHDPAKLPKLVAAPVSEWEAILSAPDSPDQPQAFTNLQQKCGARGVDTAYPLLHSSLIAMHAQAGQAKFILVSGDLIAHGFDCRYTSLVPGTTGWEYATFVEKTMAFLMAQIRGVFPSVIVYPSLGNNDTVCGDYQLDNHDEALTSIEKILVEDLPSPEERQQVLQNFAAGGYYSLTMASPMRNTRLLVLNDLFMSQHYASCAGPPDPTGATEQLAWLSKKLAEARRQNQKVWVMGHIPPGVDLYSTFSKMRDICSTAKPEMFMTQEKLADLLIEYSDVVRLAIFGHTHLDELRLLQPESHSGKAESESGVPVKIVPSISPVNGNNPSFTVAQINPESGRLMDYQVFAGSNQTGVDSAWNEEYSYSETYHQASFSPVALKKLISEFKADPQAKTAESQAYIRYCFVGDRSPVLKPLWPYYVCAMSHNTPAGFTACACSPQHEASRSRKP